MLTYRERVTKGLEYLTEGLYPFVEEQLRAVYGDQWIQAARSSFREDRNALLPHGDVVRWDAHWLLTVMWDQWNAVFKRRLGQLERSLVCELRDFRNRWAHQKDFDFYDAYRVLDSIQRLLEAAESPLADAVRQEREEVLRERLSEELESQAIARETRRERITVVTVYSLCCIAIVAQLLCTWGWEAGILAGILVLTFAYLCYKKLRSQPVLFGPRECRRCRKIIYTADCPYCQAVRLDGPVTTQLKEDSSFRTLLTSDS